MCKISLLVVLACSFFVANTVNAQRINYFVAFPNLAHHEARIELIVGDIPTRNAVFHA